MKRFCALIKNIDSTTATSQKVKWLSQYFIEEENELNKLWAIALFTGKRPPRAVNTTLLRTWAAENAGIPLWLFEANYQIVGDLAETIALILPKVDAIEEISLSDCINQIQQCKTLTEENKKDTILNFWNRLDNEQLWIFNKLITGGFRVGVSKNLIIQALAVALQVDKNTIAHHIMGSWSPDSVSWNSLFDFDGGLSDMSKPYPFYLSHAIDDAEVLRLSPNEWIAEWKWDGMRSQLIVRKGHIYLWSRGEELITDKFPEFMCLIESKLDFVIDGEIVIWGEDKPRDFQELQTRIGRKNITKKILTEKPALIIAYDILEYQGIDIRARPLVERRIILEQVIKELPNSHILLSPHIDYDDISSLIELRGQARSWQAEGMMLKRKSGIYHVGRKTGDMWKWKIEPYTLDAVMLYAQRGHGRRANLYSDFTFALWDGDKLVPFAKAYSGLTDVEMKEITAFVKENAIESFGPVTSVQPILVFELAFEGISKSSRHKAGISVRFPRISRWRKDKLASQANSLEDAKTLL